MPTDQNPKQLIVERIKNASNILVTVSRDPSVDELAGALGLTLMLDKMDKAATAVFSGKIPPAIDFLEPGKTFEENVDSLRDFIIALDKSKADRLRYKVEDDVVRVFITPYKTTISEADLTFSQGDFNVDLIIALGVEKREDLDTAVTAHGRILHDATTVTINMTPADASLGEIDWADTNAGSFCEMLMSLSEALQSGLLDQQIATAILTGLVSATDRFRNDKTSPKVMTMAAQLMAAGANQQLIAEKLEEAATVTTGDLQEAVPAEQAPAEEPEKKSNDGEMKVSHDETAPAAEEPRVVESQTPAEKASTDALKEAEKELDAALATKDTEQQPVLPSLPEPPKPLISHAKISSWRDAPVPNFGGTLNATTEEAEEDKEREANDEQNHVLLSHDGLELPTASVAPALNSATLPSTEPAVTDIFAQPPSEVSQPADDADAATLSKSGIRFEATPLPSEPASQPANQTLADLEAEVAKKEAAEAASTGAPSVDDARAAVDAALGAIPFNPAGQPLAATGAQPLGDTLTHDASVSSVPPVPPPPAPLPNLPPLPDFSTLPQLPSQQPVEPEVPAAMPNFGLPEQPLSDQSQQSAPSSDPGEFKLPGSN